MLGLVKWYGYPAKDGTWERKTPCIPGWLPDSQSLDQESWWTWSRLWRLVEPPGSRAGEPRHAGSLPPLSGAQTT